MEKNNALPLSRARMVFVLVWELLRAAVEKGELS